MPGPADASAQAKRARILEAARTVCARGGFEAARMERIAAEAKVSKGTLYRFFESKEELLLASLIDAHLGDSFADGGSEPGSAAPGERLERLLERAAATLSLATARMPVNMQAWGLVVGDPGRRELLHQALRDHVYPVRSLEVVEALADGIESGVYRSDVDPAAFAAGVLAVFDGTLYRSMFDPRHANADTLRASWRMLLHSIRAPRESDHGG